MKQPTAFSQRDSTWAGEILGTGKYTIGQAGCLLCGAASMLVDWGVPTDPSRLNRWLISNGGYGKGDLLVWRALEGLGVVLEDLVNCEDVAAPVELMARALDDEKAVLVEVDGNAGPKLEHPHWLRLCSLQSRGGWAVDSWQPSGSEMLGISRYLYGADTVALGVYYVGIYRNNNFGTRSWPLPALSDAEEHQARVCLHSGGE